jgi:hypothetical protein
MGTRCWENIRAKDGPRADDFRAPWFAAQPTDLEWTAILEYSKTLHQACFPLEGFTPPPE